jgi:hypothetical protein
MNSSVGRISDPSGATFAQIWAFLQSTLYKTGQEGAMKKQGFSPAAIIAIVILVGLLAWAGWYAVGAWNAMSGVHMSALGWFFMALGAVVTFLVGAGLMALVFYSSRHDMDR